MQDAQTAGARILVVDDDREVAFAVGKIIERRGHTVQIVNNGRAVMDALRKFHPQVVVLDIGLPGLDGYDIMRLVRQEPGCESVLIVVVSGYDQGSDKLKSKVAGANYHLSKPVDFEKLLTILAKAVPRGAV